METAQSTTADLGLVGRMLNTFLAPADTFEAVQRSHSKADWLVPALIAAIVSAGSMWLALPVQQKMQAEAVEKVMARQNLTPEQQAQQREMMEKMAGVSSISSIAAPPVMVFAMVFIAAGVLLLVGRLALGGEVTYGKTLALAGYVTLISVPHNIVLTPIRLARETLMVTLGPGLLLDAETLGTFLGRFINGIDIFVVWQVVVTAIGLSILTRAAFGKTLGVLLVLWVLVLAASAGLTGLTPGM